MFPNHWDAYRCRYGKHVDTGQKTLLGKKKGGNKQTNKKEKGRKEERERQRENNKINEECEKIMRNKKLTEMLLE